jgi:UDP-3-O-[3-hydroxymyristoyl] glucosamine N-acyltransferase
MMVMQLRWSIATEKIAERTNVDDDTIIAGDANIAGGTAIVDDATVATGQSVLSRHLYLQIATTIA